MIETQLLYIIAINTSIMIYLGLIGILIKLYQLKREKPSRSDYRDVRGYNIKR